MDGVIMNMFSQNEIILMIGVVSVLLISISVLTALDIKDYLQVKKGILDDEEVSLDTNEKEETLEPISVSIKEEIPAVVVEKPEEKEVYLEEMEEESFEPQKEVNPVIEKYNEVVIPNLKEEIEAKPEKKKLDILEELEAMENSLPNKKDDVTNFEMEQERTAIISLDELMQKSNELYNDNETVQYDDGDEPISIDEVIKMFNRDDKKPVVEEQEEKKVPEVFQEVVEDKAKEIYAKKETIPFISSVYGIEKENNALEFENTATYEKLDRQNYNDFVSQLREMGENK